MLLWHLETRKTKCEKACILEHRLGMAQRWLSLAS